MVHISQTLEEFSVRAPTYPQVSFKSQQRQNNFVKEMDTRAQSGQLMQAVSDITSQATREGKNQPLTKETHWKLFVSSGSRASKAGEPRRLELKTHGGLYVLQANCQGRGV